jgi:beta-glucanase (GH16 family)
MQYPFGKPFYLLLDTQIGGSWVGEIDPKDYPVEMEIDWVRYYQRK